MNKSWILLAGTIIVVGAGLFATGSFSGGSASNADQTAAVANVSQIDGKQVIDISVKGGYSPRISTAQANMPTTLRFQTNGTYDCSSSLVIPALSYRSRLPQFGTTEVEVPPQLAGTILQGTCSMGMYGFKVSFN